MRHGLRELRKHPAGRRDRVLRSRGSRPHAVARRSEDPPLHRGGGGERREPEGAPPPPCLAWSPAPASGGGTPFGRFGLADTCADAPTTFSRSFIRPARRLAAAIARRGRVAPCAGAIAA